MQALLASNEAMRVDIAKLQIQVAFIEQHYATKADIEMVKTMVADARGEFYRAMQAQTWKLISWMTVVCSALTAAVYFIARNVH
ncbi:hypothetical protein Jab_1c25200 [Janthinobacterium sp. HH01]|nr:hypothetical protein Jab_1c25200 [Janthinobacterium sp. HH01]